MSVINALCWQRYTTPLTVLPNRSAVVGRITEMWRDTGNDVNVTLEQMQTNVYT